MTISARKLNGNVKFGTILNDTLFGTSNDDLLYALDGDDLVDAGEGQDLIDGGAGNDSLTGNNGNDTLFGNDGIDQLLGDNGNDALYGWNGNDRLYGGSGNDFLDGQAGIDELIGGLGNDTYVLSNRLDRIVEAPRGGNDTVRIPFRIGSRFTIAGIENFTLLGTVPLAKGNGLSNRIQGNAVRNILDGRAGNDRLLGNAGSDVLTGGTGDDVLIGGRGKDFLTGSSGSDRFTFNARSEGRDTITDFAVTGDAIYIARAGFSTRLAKGILDEDIFTTGSGASEDSDRFIYNPNTGVLSFDADGADGGRAVAIAYLRSNPDISHRNIVIT